MCVTKNPPMHRYKKSSKVMVTSKVRYCVVLCEMRK